MTLEEEQITAKNGPIVRSQKKAKPAVSTMVAATAPRERRETVGFTASSRLMMKMESVARPMWRMLRSMSLTKMLII